MSESVVELMMKTPRETLKVAAARRLKWLRRLCLARSESSWPRKYPSVAMPKIEPIPSAPMKIIPSYRLGVSECVTKSPPRADTSSLKWTLGFFGDGSDCGYMVDFKRV